MLWPGADPVLGSGPNGLPPIDIGSEIAPDLMPRPSLAQARVRTAHRRTVRVLAASQIAGGLGIGASVSVGGLLALDISGSEIWAGGSTTAVTLGAAAMALPLAAVAARSGRRRSLSIAWGLAALGAFIVVLAAILASYVLLVVGMLVLGSGNAANYQSRYAATDLALPERRSRDLSLIVWSSTVGTVLGPNLTEPGRVVADLLNIPPLVGPFVFAAVGMLVAAVLLLSLLRPDPLLLSRRLADPVAPEPTPGPLTADPAHHPGSVWSTVRRSPGARLGMSAVVVSHAVMVAVMTMAPVHLSQHHSTLTVIGVTISLHIAGMFAFSPLFGWLADKRGRVTTILVGEGLLLAAAVAAGTSGGSQPRLMLGLFLLGLGWSAGLVAGSTLLAESVPAEIRVRVQGTSDMVMNLVGAAGGALSGVLLALIGFGGLNAVACLMTLPILVFAVSAGRR